MFNQNLCELKVKLQSTQEKETIFDLVAKKDYKMRCNIIGNI